MCFFSRQSVEKSSTMKGWIVLEDHHSSLHEVLGIIHFDETQHMAF